MKRLFILFILLIPTICNAAPPVRSYTYVDGTTIVASEVTTNEDNIYNYLQTGVDTYSDDTIVNADIDASAAISNTKLDLTNISQDITHSGVFTQTGTAVIADLTATTADINGGTWQGTIDGNWTAASQTCADLGTVTTADINAGTINGLTSLGMTTVTNITDIVDEDTMVSDSNQYLATQQSIKAYVDSFENYSAGDIMVAAADTEQSATGEASYIKVKEISVGRTGTLTIKFDLKTGNQNNPSKGRIYRNGVAVGTERTSSGSGYTTFSEDISGWTKGDLCQLYYHDDSSVTVYIRNFRLYTGGNGESVVLQD